MKIRIKQKSYDEVLAMPKAKHIKPMKQLGILRKIVPLISIFDYWQTRFSYEKIGMEKLGDKEPCLILMNHSSFLDLKIAFRMLHNRPFNIVSTSDAFVGKNILMRLLGCIPTKKFITDPNLIRDMMYVLKNLKSSVLMYPEAGYSFDGKSTTLPESVGRLIKMLNVPVVMITAYGAFARDPLYNGLRLRKVKVTAKMEYVLSPEEIKGKTPQELNEIVRECFSFDNFRWQQENKVRIKEKFRAEGLNRVLYKCPKCKTEGKMQGKGTRVFCEACSKEYELTEYGYMKALRGETEFPHIPDWFEWQRDCVRNEISEGSYLLDIPVDIYVLRDTKCLYKVGDGQLRHDEEGFHLNGCDGKIDYHQKPSASYCLNADYFWYEIGDVISIGDYNMLYYCFPKQKGDVVAKTRLATEEMYKIAAAGRKKA